MRRLTCALVGLWVVTVISPVGAASHGAQMRTQKGELGFFFQHLRGSLLNESSSGPWNPERHEIIRLDEWSPDGWAPRGIDLAFTGPGIDRNASQLIKQVRVTLSLKVRELRIDSEVRVTNQQRLVDSAQWWPVEFVKIVAARDLVWRDGHLVVLEKFDFGKIIDTLLKDGEGLFPTEIEVRALIEWNGDAHRGREAYDAHLKVIAGD